MKKQEFFTQALAGEFVLNYSEEQYVLLAYLIHHGYIKSDYKTSAGLELITLDVLKNFKINYAYSRRNISYIYTTTPVRNHDGEYNYIVVMQKRMYDIMKRVEKMKAYD